LPNGHLGEYMYGDESFNKSLPRSVRGRPGKVNR